MKTQKRKTKQRVRKKPQFISTDAALVAATVPAILLELLETEGFAKSFIVPMVQSSQGTTVLSFSELAKLYKKALASACDGAADFLSKVLFAERLFKRLTFDDPRHVVAFLYCLVRMAPNSEAIEKQLRPIKDHFGKYWRWPLVWLVAKEVPIVKSRIEIERARGEVCFDGWVYDCQKYANNLWNEEKRKTKQVTLQKKAMIQSLKTHPIAQKLFPQT
jgi:hypothetical protein